MRRRQSDEKPASDFLYHICIPILRSRLYALVQSPAPDVCGGDPEGNEAHHCVDVDLSPVSASRTAPKSLEDEEGLWTIARMSRLLKGCPLRATGENRASATRLCGTVDYQHCSIRYSNIRYSRGYQ